MEKLSEHKAAIVKICFDDPWMNVEEQCSLEEPCDKLEWQEAMKNQKMPLEESFEIL